MIGLMKRTALIRKGSINALAKCSDFDYMYLNKGQLEIRFFEKTLRAVHDLDGCASIEVALTNITDLPVTIIAGELLIHDIYGEEVTILCLDLIDLWVLILN